MRKYIALAYEALHKKFMVQPVKYEVSEVMKAWSKIDSILNNAERTTHVETAQRMFDNMLHHFQFTEEQKRSPLIAGMQARINEVYRQDHVMEIRESPVKRYHFKWKSRILTT